MEWPISYITFILLSEVDVRGTYTLLAVARLLNILTPELCGNSADFVRRCPKISS